MPKSNFIEIPTRYLGRILINLDQVTRITTAENHTSTFLLVDGNSQDCTLDYASLRSLITQDTPPAAG